MTLEKKEVAILIVEDEAIFAEDLKNRIQRLGYHVIGMADSVDDALKIVEEKKIDLVLMDIMLQGDKSGIHAANIIREQHHIPVIFLSAYSDQNTLEQAKVTEAHAYLLKPLRERELQITIEMVLYKYETERKLRHNEAMLNAILGGIREAVIAADVHRRVLFMNNIAEKFTGVTKEQAIGQPIEDIVKVFDERNKTSEQEQLMQFFEQNNTCLENHSLLIQSAKHGSMRPVTITVTQLTGKDQTRMGFVLTCRDISLQKQMEMMRREYLSIITHDLKSPLTAIRGSLSLLKNIYAEEIPPQARKVLNIAYNSSSSMIRLVSDILDSERVESGKLDFVFDTEQLLPLIEQVEVEMKGFADHYGVSIQCEYPSQEITVYIDAQRFIQALSNLVSNAVKYSPEHETVRINVSKREDTVAVSVRDRGQGIPDSIKEKIFEKFYMQEDKTTSLKQVGTGLGLFITKQIVEEMKGRIELQTKEGEGSTFTIVLPLAKEEENHRWEHEN